MDDICFFFSLPAILVCIRPHYSTFQLEKGITPKQAIGQLDPAVMRRFEVLDAKMRHPSTKTKTRLAAMYVFGLSSRHRNPPKKKHMLTSGSAVVHDNLNPKKKRA